MHHASSLETGIFTVLLVGMILCLAFEEKIHAKKSVIVAIFAVITLFLATAFGLVKVESVEVLGTPIKFPIYIPGVDWEVIAIILGSSLFVDVTSKSGLFTWIAITLTKVSRGDPLRLLVFYGLLTVVFSAVLNNVTAMIIIGTLTGVSLKKLGRDEALLGFLLVEGLLTNVGGLLTLISSVPKIIVGNAAGITFVEFFLKAGPYVVVATAATLWLGAKIYGIRALAGDAERAAAAELVAGFDENDGLESKGFFWFGTAMTLLFIATMASIAVTPVINELGMGFVALTFAAIMLVRYKSVADRFYQAVDWDLIAFFVGLFIVINMMEHALVLDLIGDGLKPVIGLGETLGTGAMLVAAAVASSVTDNIPLAAMLAKILGGVGLESTSSFWWAVIFGANLGGNLTPIGSASTSFVKAALPFAVMQLILAVAYVLIFLN